MKRPVTCGMLALSTLALLLLAMPHARLAPAADPTPRPGSTRFALETRLIDDRNELFVRLTNLTHEKIEIDRPGVKNSTWTLAVWEDDNAPKMYRVLTVRPEDDKSLAEPLTVPAGSDLSMGVSLTVGDDKPRYTDDHLDCRIALAEASQHARVALFIDLSDEPRLASNLITIDAIRKVDEKTAQAIGEGLLAALRKFAADHPEAKLPPLDEKPVVAYNEFRRLTVRVSKDLEEFRVNADSAISGGYPFMEGRSRWCITAARKDNEWKVLDCRHIPGYSNK